MDNRESMRGAAKFDKRTLLTNAIWNWLGFAVSVAITFVTWPILIRLLGDQRYGVWSLVEATVAYIALLDLGIGASVVRYVAKFEAIKDKEQLNRVFSTTLCIFLIGGAIAVAVSAGVAALWDRPFGLPGELAADARWLILLLGLNVALRLVIGVFSATLYGLGRFPARVLIGIVMHLGGAALMLGVLFAGGGLVELGVSILLCAVIGGIMTAAVVRRCLPDLCFSPGLANFETLRSIGGYSILAFVTMMAGRIAYSSDPIVIGSFLGPEYITFYVIAARLIQYVRESVQSIVNVLTPAISALEAQGNQEAIRRAFVVGTRYVLWIIMPVEVGLLVLGRPFLSLWLGERYAEQSYPTLVILSIPLFLVASQRIAGRILYGIGRLKWLTAATVTWAITNVGISVVLVNYIGIEGVALGTAVPHVVFSVALGCYMCRVLGVPFLYWAQRSMGKPLAAVPVAWAVWHVSGQLIPPTNWGSLLAVGALGTFAYATVALVLEFGPNAVGQIRRVVYRRQEEG
jgi:O-antigen/teichoic acid export membrane protein